MIGSYSYDAQKLADVSEFNAAKAEMNFSEKNEYFSKLDEFVESWPHFLRDYNPVVVIYGDEARNAFVEDMERIRSVVLSLDMDRVLAEINNLEEAISNQDAKSLSDGLLRFYATLEIAANCIIASRIEKTAHTASSPAYNSTDKPVILAVDDRPEILASIQGMLREDFKIIAVTSGIAAQKAITAHNPVLFLLDIEMPGMDGYELARIIRSNEKYKNTPILFLTGKATMEHVLTAKDYGVNDYMLKPVSKEILFQKIRTYLP